MGNVSGAKCQGPRTQHPKISVPDGQHHHHWLQQSTDHSQGVLFVCPASPFGSEALIKILTTAYSSCSSADDMFIFHRQRYQSPKSFENAIRRQNEIESSKRIIAVKGLNPAHMFHFSEILRANFSKNEDIFATPNTFDLNPGGQPLGRYNLLCTKDDFIELATSLSISLASTYQTFLTQ
jgi:hypothetical protein